MSKKTLAKAFAASLADIDDDDDSATATPEQIKEALVRLAVKHTFQPGDVVQWKPGMKNKRCPDYGQPAVVAEVLELPIIRNDNHGTPYFREPIALALAHIDSDGDLLLYNYDLRRFEPYSGDVA